MRWMGAAFLVFLVAFLGAAAELDADEKPAAAPEKTGVTAEQRDAALKKAFLFLDDQLWKLGDGGSSHKPYAAAVAGWAYLLAAEKGVEEARKLPSRGKQIQRIRDYLTRQAETVARLYERDDKRRKKEERRKRPPRADPRDPRGRRMGMRTAQYVWNLSMAGHFFSEAAARKKKTGESKKVLKKIVHVLESAQQEDGGWGHDDAARPGMGLPPIQIPKPGGGSLSYPPTLLAASNCALSALGVANRTLGKKKPTRVITKGIAYFRKSQNGNGTFPYDPGQKHKMPGRMPMAGGIETARTGGALFALLLSGVAPDDEMAAKAAAAMDADPALLHEGHGSACMALQLSALAMHQRGDNTWAVFRKTFFPRILEQQQKDGSFRCACAHKSMGVTCDTKPLRGMPAAGPWMAGKHVYVTAIYTLVLMLDRASTKAPPPVPAGGTGKKPTTPRSG